jgi:ABC-type transport system substrate-binding protein
LGVVLAGCVSPPPQDDIVRVVIGADEQARRVDELVYDALPALALSIEHTGPLTVVVHLRHGVTFHDGHELTAKDVVYTFREVPAVRALDDSTIEFTLTEPSSTFPMELARPVVPDGAGASLRTFPIGTGPYRFARSTTEAIELTAFEGYWDGLPQNAGVTLRIVPDEAARARELRNGTADIVVDDTRVVARPNIQNVRLTPQASFATLKDVRKVAPYGPDRTGPSDAGRY